MELEDTGYSIKNQNKIWIDPTDYQTELEKAACIKIIRNRLHIFFKKLGFSNNTP